jgi:hypothetical protein
MDALHGFRELGQNEYDAGRPQAHSRQRRANHVDEILMRTFCRHFASQSRGWENFVICSVTAIYVSIKQIQHDNVIVHSRSKCFPSSVRGAY